MEDKECYLKFESWGESITITKDHSDITVDDFYEMCRQICTAQFGEVNTKEVFDNFLVENKSQK